MYYKSAALLHLKGLFFLLKKWSFYIKSSTYLYKKQYKFVFCKSAAFLRISKRTAFFM